MSNQKTYPIHRTFSIRGIVEHQNRFKREMESAKRIYREMESAIAEQARFGRDLYQCIREQMELNPVKEIRSTIEALERLKKQGLPHTRDFVEIQKHARQLQKTIDQKRAALRLYSP